MQVVMQDFTGLKYEIGFLGATFFNTAEKQSTQSFVREALILVLTGRWVATEAQRVNKREFE
ncbi:hypothetical protein DDZ15_01045 [Rhodohalobacter mucosus]|uniref:Uncharacterized protein n=1 Tax=Rhodohalobacter mucosus TaxID=2079485 RepID=A0A316TUV5_9BACT|nr:hypothetical protein DDZ15_01045 [Rhodohalobacter mucosus]